MIRAHKTLILFCFFFTSVFFLSGCERLKTIDQQIGRFISGELLGEKAENIPASEEVSEPTTQSIFNKEQKEKIDKWLELNGFNRYGDPMDTFYSSGTPLFDVKSGLTKERYEYILERHPDVMTKI